jgi:hypothetical protein
MLYTICYVKNTGSKRDRQEHYYGVISDLSKIEEIKQNITEKIGKCIFNVYSASNFVFTN